MRVALHAETSDVKLENLVTGESSANKPPATARSVTRGGDEVRVQQWQVAHLKYQASRAHFRQPRG